QKLLQPHLVSPHGPALLPRHARRGDSAHLIAEAVTLLPLWNLPTAHSPRERAVTTLSLELGPKWIRLRRTYCNCFWNPSRLPTHEQLQCVYQLDSAPQPALGHGRTLTYLMRARVLTCGRRNLLDNPL